MRVSFEGAVGGGGGCVFRVIILLFPKQTYTVGIPTTQVRYYELPLVYRGGMKAGTAFTMVRCYLRNITVVYNSVFTDTEKNIVAARTGRPYTRVLTFGAAFIFRFTVIH